MGHGSSLNQHLRDWGDEGGMTREGVMDLLHNLWRDCEAQSSRSGEMAVALGKACERMASMNGRHGRQHRKAVGGSSTTGLVWEEGPHQAVFAQTDGLC